LARKNPNLHTLKNRFNLDIDYWYLPIGIWFQILRNYANKYKNSLVLGMRSCHLNSNSELHAMNSTFQS
jgi:hypothetical protein